MAELEKLLCTDSKVESLKKINAIIENGGGGTGLQIFDTILKDHILTYEETKGLALQGTYVYKEAIAGSRYGYPDFYNKVVEEFNETTNTETVNGVTVKVHSNGHKFYDIADKDSIDNFFNTMGTAWFYGIDTENERILLPRNSWFEQATLNESEVGQSVEAGLPNITGKFTSIRTWDPNPKATGAFAGTTYYDKALSANSGTHDDVAYLYLDASLSSPVYGNSDTVQPNAVKKLLYICVGNTTNYEGVTDVVNQGMEILEQVAQKVNVDGTNLNAEGKSLFASLPMPSNKYIDLTLGASGTTYIAPANGWFMFGGRLATAQTRAFLTNYGSTSATQSLISFYITSTIDNQQINMSIPVKKGDIVNLTYNTLNTSGGYTVTLRFTYAVGSESEAQ